MNDNVSQVFAALSDPTRRGLYEQLLESPKGYTATELALNASVSRQAIVKHLQVLSLARLATSHREGREVRFFASSKAAATASTWLNERAVAWDRRVVTLEREVRSGTPRRNVRQ
jgi:DNA-binding transcriptional ArsR family regulator